MKLRGETAELRIETGRWCGLRKDERICRMCDKNKVENVEHFLLHCNDMVEERRKMVRLMNEDYRGVASDGRQRQGGMCGKYIRHVRMEGYENVWIE